MNVTVKANYFCPDDCKYCALKERLEAGDNGYLELVRYCNNEELCRYLFEVIKAQYEKENNQLTENS